MISLNLYSLIIIIIFFISLFSALSYVYVWKRYVLTSKVPQGYGLIVIYFIFILSLFLNLNVNYVYTFFTILILSSIYWIDDFKNLSAKSRIFLQSICGILILSININILEEQILIFIIFAILFSLLSIILTNITNFYDGLDLNLSVFIIINSAICIYIFNNNSYIILILLTIIVFMITFSFFNSKKNNLYFGDSGCFVFSSFLIFLIISAYNQNNVKIFYLFITLSLPLVDVFYVLLYRVLKKESLLTRNHYHLYQKYGKIFKNKSYLLLQLINSFLIICILGILSYFYIISSNIIVLISLTTTIIFYLFSSLFINEYTK